MKEPTELEIREFTCAANTLARLGESGLTMYLAMDTLCLMRGPAHDNQTMRPLRKRSEVRSYSRRRWR